MINFGQRNFRRNAQENHQLKDRNPNYTELLDAHISLNCIYIYISYFVNEANIQQQESTANYAI